MGELDPMAICSADDKGPAAFRHDDDEHEYGDRSVMGFEPDGQPARPDLKAMPDDDDKEAPSFLCR